jgi:hypothetical protein
MEAVKAKEKRLEGLGAWLPECGKLLAHLFKRLQSQQLQQHSH